MNIGYWHTAGFSCKMYTRWAPCTVAARAYTEENLEISYRLKYRQPPYICVFTLHLGIHCSTLSGARLMSVCN